MQGNCDLARFISLTYHVVGWGGKRPKEGSFSFYYHHHVRHILAREVRWSVWLALIPMPIETESINLLLTTNKLSSAVSIHHLTMISIWNISILVDEFQLLFLLFPSMEDAFIVSKYH